MNSVFTQSVLSLSVTIPVASIFGLFVGSFLNVVVYRAPLGLRVHPPIVLPHLRSPTELVRECARGLVGRRREAAV